MDKDKDKPNPDSEPLPIWFFVGLILLAYGVILIIADFLPQPRDTVLAETRPALWWGAITTVGGAVFLAVGLRGRGKRGKDQRES